MGTIQLLGTYGRERYRNIHNGFAVFNLIVADPQAARTLHPKLGKEVACSGTIPEYRQGTPLLVEGTIEETRKYGVQLQIKSIKEQSWSTACTASYLTNICSGIGTATATAIATMFPDIFEFVKQEDAPQILASRTSLSLETAVMLCDTVRETCVQREVYNMVAPYGAPWIVAWKIAKKHGLLATQELKNNPYSTGMECGMDFYSCDRFAKATNMGAADKARVKQAIVQAFEYERNAGNTYSTARDICRGAQTAVRKSAFNEKIPSTVFLDAMAGDEDIVIDSSISQESIYKKFLYNDECGVAREVARLINASEPLNYDKSVINWAEESCGIKYAPQQKQSFNLIKRSGIAIITGGPGTGKTTTVNGLINAYEKLNPDKIIRMCAPTGRAAQRMTESTGRESVTIHRLLEYKPYGGSDEVSHKDATNPINADLIVVDEASMLDISLAHIFLSAVKNGTLVLFIGDINQLPSVGAGDVLNDFITSKQIPVVQLTTVYRQGKQSPIIQNAYRINKGVNALIDSNEYRTMTCESAEALANAAVSIIAESYDPEAPFDTQILCPTHKGDAGVAALNTILQNLLNPCGQGKKELRYGTKVFRVGDKVILTNNNYAVGYFNGDIGVVKDATSDSVCIDVMGKEIMISKGDMEDLSLAYAMTIHKSQGSEFKNVVVIMPKQPSTMLKRNLLYTAVTRAKKTVQVLSEKDAAVDAIYNEETGTRKTHLAVRIQRAMTKNDD